MNLFVRAPGVVLGLFDDGVALAGERFELLAVEDGHLAATVPNAPRLLERAGRFGDALPPRPQHVGEEFLREPEFIKVYMVLSRKQLAAESLPYGVKAVTDGGLGYLRDERIGVAEDQVVQRPAPVELGLKNSGLQPLARAFGLHHYLVGRSRNAHDQRDAYHPVVADHAYLDDMALFRDREQRAHAAVREIGVIYLVFQLEKQVPVPEVDGLRVRGYILALRLPHGCENNILGPGRNFRTTRINNHSRILPQL